MPPLETGGRKASLKSKLLNRLHDLVQLRAFVTAAVLLTAYVAVYTPLNGGIEETARKLAKERKTVELASSVEGLRTEFHRFEKRLPKGADSKEWV